MVGWFLKISLLLENLHTIVGIEISLFSHF